MKTDRALFSILRPAAAFLVVAFFALPETASAQWYGFRSNARPAAKIDIDADFNKDGRIDNNDPSDNGPVQVTPPGLEVSTKRLERAVIRYKVSRPDRRGDTMVRLEIRGVNRRAKSGKFANFREERARTGRIRIWADPEKRRLLLDSGDPSRRQIDFTKETGAVPQNIYLEGVAPSADPGSFQLIAQVLNRGRLARFGNYHDYILVTVTP